MHDRKQGVWPQAAAGAGPRPRPTCLAQVVAPAQFEVRGDMRARVIWRLFLERHLSWVPVVDENGRPIGTLLRDDLAVAFGGTAPPSRGDAGEEAPIVEDFMRREGAVLRADASLAEACALLDASLAPAVVVIDHKGSMVGTVSRATLRSLHPPPRGH